MKFKNITLKELLCAPKDNVSHKCMLAKLKEAGLPNYIFGGAGAAALVADMLIKESVKIDGFLESKHYFKANRELLGRPVFLYDEEADLNEKRNIIVAATGNNVRSILSRERDFGNEIFLFDVFKPHYGMSYEWICEHIGELEKTFSLLEDDMSKETFLAFLNGKAHCISGDVRPLWSLWNSDQYFNELYAWGNFEIHAMVDCGAWIGDTAEEYLGFLHKAGMKGYVYAFEPDPGSYAKLKQTAERIGNIECFPYAVGDTERKVAFCAKNSTDSYLSENEDGIQVDMIPADNVLSGKRVSLIKMDLEGGEEKALIGLRDTIRTNAPMLAVCVYHKADDWIKIPNRIETLVKETGRKYKYYLRHHSAMPYETVMYAIPN